MASEEVVDKKVEETIELKYDRILEELESKIDAKKSSTFNLDSLDYQLKELEYTISKLENTELSSDSPIIKKRLAEEAAKVSSDYSEEAEKLAKRKRHAIETDQHKRMDIVTSIKNKLFGEDMLKHAYRTIKDASYIDSSSFDDVVKTPVENYKELHKRAKMFIDHLALIDETDRPVCFKLADVVCFRKLFSKMDNPKVAFATMSAYILILVVAASYLSSIALLGYTVVTGLSVRDALRFSADQDAIAEELALLKKSYASNETVYNDNFNLELEKETKELDTKLGEIMKDINEKETCLKENCEKLLASIKLMETDPKYAEEHLGVYKERLNTLKRELEEYLEAKSDGEEELETAIKEYEELLVEKNRLKGELEEKYFKNLKPGTSRLFCGDIYLGFDEEDESLVPFELCLEPSIILYTGESSSVTNVTMSIFLQILRNTNPASLNIKVFDTVVSAQDFGPFTQDELSEVVELYTTKNKCDSAIKELEETLRIRNREILTDADDIDDFNKKMLEKNSLTKDYIVLLIQDSGGAIFNNPTFQTICKAGPKVGIIPIVFLSLEESNSLKGADNTDKYEEYAEIYTVVPHKYYKYTSEKDSFLEFGENYRESLLLYKKGK